MLINEQGIDAIIKTLGQCKKELIDKEPKNNQLIESIDLSILIIDIIVTRQELKKMRRDIRNTNRHSSQRNGSLDED